MPCSILNPGSYVDTNWPQPFNQVTLQIKQVHIGLWCHRELKHEHGLKMSQIQILTELHWTCHHGLLLPRGVYSVWNDVWLSFMGQTTFREGRQESGEQMQPGTAAAQWVQGQESDISVEIPAARAPGTVASLKRLQVSLYKFHSFSSRSEKGCSTGTGAAQKTNREVW